VSEPGIPASYRHMHGFGSHTFSFINAANERPVPAYGAGVAKALGLAL